MKNGDINDFLERITWGDELVFMYRGKKYFLEGLPDDNGVLITLRQKLWDGRTFMEAQEEMEWVDC